MRNFKYVNKIKEALEKECPSMVSCADIIALSARDGIVLVSASMMPFYTIFLFTAHEKYEVCKRDESF